MLFKNTGKNVLIHRQQRQKVIEMNMNILGTLLAHSATRERAIDFKNTLTYPLGPIPLTLAHPDRSRRTTTKSQLMDEILTYCNDILKPKEFYKSQEKPMAYPIDLKGGTLDFRVS